MKAKILIVSLLSAAAAASVPAEPASVEAPRQQGDCIAVPLPLPNFDGQCFVPRPKVNR